MNITEDTSKRFYEGDGVIRNAYIMTNWVQNEGEADNESKLLRLKSYAESRVTAEDAPWYIHEVPDFAYM